MTATINKHGNIKSTETLNLWKAATARNPQAPTSLGNEPLISFQALPSPRDPDIAKINVDVGIDSFCEAPGITWCDKALVNKRLFTTASPSDTHIKAIDGKLSQPIGEGTLNIQFPSSDSAQDPITMTIKKVYLMDPSTRPKEQSATVILGQDFLTNAGAVYTAKKNEVSINLPNNLGRVNFNDKQNRLYFIKATAIVHTPLCG